MYFPQFTLITIEILVKAALNDRFKRSEFDGVSHFSTGSLKSGKNEEKCKTESNEILFKK